jgi:UPF0716 family protein affecting phage T7 exclusion
MKRLGCLLLLAIVAALLVEGWVVGQVAWLLGQALDYPPSASEYFGALLLMVVWMFIGWRLLRRRMARIPLVMMRGGDFGREAVGVAGCAMMVFPGFISGVFGLLLQLPPVQALFGRAAGTVLAAMIRQAAARMGAGAAMPKGFPGGFPGMPAAAAPLKPDQQQRGKRVFDVKNED